MDTTLIFMGIAMVVVIYLIFKFIKKLVFAIFTLFLFIILIIGGISGLIYMDYNYLTSQNDFDLKIIYISEDKYLFGSNIKIKNQTPDMKSISSISSKELTELKASDISSEDKIFIVTLDEELFKSIMTKESYILPGFNDSAELKKYDLSITKFDVIEILDSQDPNAKFLEIVIKKNKLSTVEKVLFETTGKVMLEQKLKQSGISMKEAVFLTVMMEEMKNEKNAVKLVEGFKEETLNVYPERFSFKLLRMLPVDMIKSYFPQLS